jgi:dsDNA-specific endonuclease/ATPase MutS2
MIFDWMMKLLQSKRDDGPRHAFDSNEGSDEDESIDPENPFPEVVVVELKDVLDLHSIPPRQVRAVVEDYLEEARRRGYRWVRIIHGKGIGVEREIVRSILSRTLFVVDYRDAPAEAGGWGATIVTLEQKRGTMNDER